MENMNNEMELEMLPLTEAELLEVDGGAAEGEAGSWRSCRCAVKKHYLALRNHPSFKYENEIARISRGTVFSVKPSKRSGNYIWASYGGKTGWVDSRFIQYC
jgi:hypothetical protein